MAPSNRTLLPTPSLSENVIHRPLNLPFRYKHWVHHLDVDWLMKKAQKDAAKDWELCNLCLGCKTHQEVLVIEKFVRIHYMSHAARKLLKILRK